MSKYSKEQLQSMARNAITAKNNNDTRYKELIFTLSIYFNIHPDEVEERIRHLAL